MHTSRNLIKFEVEMMQMSISTSGAKSKTPSASHIDCLAFFKSFKVFKKFVLIFKDGKCLSVFFSFCLHCLSLTLLWWDIKMFSQFLFVYLFIKVCLFNRLPSHCCFSDSSHCFSSIFYDGMCKPEHFWHDCINFYNVFTIFM